MLMTSGGTSEPLSIATLNDLFFLHERGTPTGMQALALSIGNSSAPIVCGFLIQSQGWRWYHLLVSILAGINLLLIFFLVPETEYRRDLHQSMDSTAPQYEEKPNDVEKSTVVTVETVTVSGRRILRSSNHGQFATTQVYVLLTFVLGLCGRSLVWYGVSC